MRRRTHCPGCGHGRLSAPWRVARQPVVLNYRFDSAEAARRVPRRDLQLAQCLRCGLIFNSAFDVSLTPYDERYENRQSFSPAFQEHLNSLADDLIGRYDLRGKHILEVGCGKGDFLRLICERANAEGAGYDTSYEGPAVRVPERVRFYKRYVSAADINTPFDAVVCRHVVEHISAIGDFLRELRAIAVACGQPVTVIETPSFEWIAENVCFWDVFYEHCNYFSLPCLAWLCEQAGFGVASHRLTFGGQYQIIELKVDREPGRASRRPRTPVRLADFTRKAEARLKALESQLRAVGDGGWAIWGAGAKGVALVSRLRRGRPRFVIDSNPAKQGCFIPGSNVPIISPDDPRVLDLPVILVANPNYLPEIQTALIQRGFRHRLLST